MAKVSLAADRACLILAAFLVSLGYWLWCTQNVLSSGRCSIAAWGAKEGLGPLIQISATFNAASYCNIINRTFVPYALDCLFPDCIYWLQQDRSPVHTACLAEATLKSCGVLRLLLSASGADFIPIENLLSIIRKMPPCLKALCPSPMLMLFEV